MHWLIMDNIIPAVMGLVGVLIGSGLNLYQNHMLDRRKEKRAKLQMKKELLTERMKIYNKYYAMKTETHIVERIGDTNYFNVDSYLNNFRPIFFNSLHILEENIVNKILSIDKNIEVTKLLCGEIDNRTDIEIHNELLVWFAELDLLIADSIIRYQKDLENIYE